MRGQASLATLTWAVKTTSSREAKKQGKERAANSSVQAALEVHATVHVGLAGARGLRAAEDGTCKLPQGSLNRFS